MNVLVFGGSKSGKSFFAQKIAQSLSKTFPLYYLATMVPHDAEDLLRIQKHLYSRRNMGFITLEYGTNIEQAFAQINPKGTVLLESVTALLTNEMFSVNGDIDYGARDRVIHSTQVLANYMKQGNVVFVCDSLFSDGIDYNFATRYFQSVFAECQRNIASFSDLVLEIFVSKYIIYKGKDSKLIKMLDKSLNNAAPQMNLQSSIHLIIGGAFQGKTEYAIKKFNLQKGDIYECKEDSAIDFSFKCFTHIERYIKYCLSNNIAEENVFPPNSVVICDDIFCGIVPIDSFERRWRERTGEYLQRLSSNAQEVIRVSCGIGTVL